MTTAHQPMTAEDLWNLPDDGKRYELVRGELRMMTPAGFEHGNVGSQLLVRLHQHTKAHDLGIVVGADTGFVLARNPDIVRAPDVAFVARQRVEAVGVTRQYWPGAPDLAAEVVSPSDTLYDVEEKVRDWLAAGTRLVWVVNPKLRTVTVHRPGPQLAILTEGDQLGGEDVLPGCTCRVGELFG